jgi:dihydroneopterin aldolase
MNETELVVSNLDVECIIGVWDHEKQTPQRIGVDVRLLFDGSAAAQTDALSSTINYAQLTDAVAFILQHGRFELLETASQMLWSYLMLGSLPSQTAPSASFAEVILTKYDALPGPTLAKITHRGERGLYVSGKEVHAWGTVDIARENERLGVYRLNIAPGQTLPLHHHEVMKEAELIIDPGLMLVELDTGPKQVEPGTVFRWSSHHVHGYRNESEQWASILCIDSPPFIPSDEVLWTP